MDAFPLPAEIMRIVFRMSRELRRAEGREKIRPRIEAFETAFQLAIGAWVPDEIIMDDVYDGDIYMRTIEIDVPASRMFGKKLSIEYRNYLCDNRPDTHESKSYMYDEEGDYELDAEEEAHIWATICGLENLTLSG
jgi:hypothetical protein